MRLLRLGAAGAGHVDDGWRGRWLRGIAAVMASAAGVIHLAQIGPHLENGWAIAAFFGIVGIVQFVAAALLLRRPWPAAWCWMGVVGSTAVIGMWVVSRTIGGPLGPESGEAEALGAADAAASLAEAIMVVVLLLCLWDRSPRGGGRIGVMAALVVVASLGGVWSVGRASGIFDPDPRATIALPQLVDRAAFSVIAAAALMLAMLAIVPAVRPRWWPAAMRGLLGALFVASVALAGATLPASGGQNASCDYAPLAERSLDSHEAAAAVPLAAEEERWLPVLVLASCGPDPVDVESVDVLNARGRGHVLEFALLPTDVELPEAGVDGLPEGSQKLDDVPVVRLGDERELAVLLRGGSGGFNLDSVRISYRIGEERGSVAFATVLSTCLTSQCGEE